METLTDDPAEAKAGEPALAFVDKAFAALEAPAAAALEREILALLEAMNVAGPGSLVVPSEYLEIVVTKK